MKPETEFLLLHYKTIIKQFKREGEKTSWTYIEIPADIANKLKPGVKKSYRVKGMFDDYEFSGIALMPMGEGNFILALNAAIRKQIKKSKGAELLVAIEPHDDFKVPLPEEFTESLEYEPTAKTFFESLAPSHQKYFVKWINDAKTDTTKTKRIAQAVNALAKKYDYGFMIRKIKEEKDALGF